MEQTNLCFENIISILRDVELDLTHVLRVSAFLTKRDHFSEYMGVRDSFFADIPIKPASTLLIVSGFTKPEFLVEVEVIAQKLTWAYLCSPDKTFWEFQPHLFITFESRLNNLPSGGLIKESIESEYVWM